MNKIFPVIIVLSILIAITVGFWFGNHADKSAVPKIDGIVLHPAKQIKDFKFRDHKLKDFSAANLLGQWHLLFFGFAHCTDVCPTTLNTLNMAYEKMSSSEKEKTSVVFVSVDPLRDTPEVLDEYLSHFNEKFIGITATDKKLKNFTQQLGVAYMKSETENGDSETNYLMDHSSRILIINPRAELQAYLRTSGSPQTLINDIRKTQSFYDNNK